MPHGSVSLAKKDIKKMCKFTDHMLPDISPRENDDRIKYSEYNSQREKILKSCQFLCICTVTQLRNFTSNDTFLLFIYLLTKLDTISKTFSFHTFCLLP